MLDLEVIPERSLGCENWEFILGMHFSQAVCIIQNQVGVIKNVQVLYSDSNPLSTDLEINLNSDGIRLCFDPISQRLKLIEMYNMKFVQLKYSGLIFSSSEICPTIEQIEHSFGATHPGIYDSDKKTYTLHFRGISFTFPSTKSQSDYYRGMTKVKPSSSPTVSLISVYSSSANDMTSNPFTTTVLSAAPPLPISVFNGQLYLERCVVLSCGHRMSGLRLHLYAEGTSRLHDQKRESLTREIRLGDTCQTITTLIGAPNKVFYKSEDKMKIHSPQASKKITSERSDYFFNYFTLGFDVLFDATTHKAKKLVLHTNYPGHYNFNMYHRCEFLLNIPLEKNSKNLIESQNLTIDPSHIQVTAYTKWETISENLSHSQRPVVLNRASINTKNFFGATLCYGYKDLIFEIMSNQHIASVTIYKNPNYEI